MATIKFKPKKVMSVHYTLLMSLPAVWCNSVGINKGDPIECEMNDDQSLTIRKIQNDKRNTTNEIE